VETKQLIYEMLTENTGKHFLDSGGDDNRWWQRNQKKTLQDFEDEEEETMHKDGDYYYRNVSVFHYLSQLELDNICRDFNELNTNTKDWEGEAYGVCKTAWKFLKVGGRGFSCTSDFFEIEEGRTFNTYNGESDLSQILQGTWLTINDEEYLLLQIHNGCDARGGYTDAKLFKTRDGYGLIHEYLQEFMYQEEIEEELKYREETITK
tara:strand:- start:259 stop:879 length:621 start_codon:yes stop_codon:yes gene_type:complete